MQLFHFWSRDLHRIQNLLLCTKFHQNRMIFTARRVCITRTMPWQDVCPSVCLSHAGIESKRLYISSMFFSPSGSPTILVFPYQTGWQYSDGNPLTGASNAREYEKITISDQYRALSRNWCKANRKLHPSFRMVPVWMTFGDLFKRLFNVK